MNHTFWKWPPLTYTDTIIYKTLCFFYRSSFTRRGRLDCALQGSRWGGGGAGLLLHGFERGCDGAGLFLDRLGGLLPLDVKHLHCVHVDALVNLLAGLNLVGSLLLLLLLHLLLVMQLKEGRGESYHFKEPAYYIVHELFIYSKLLESIFHVPSPSSCADTLRSPRQCWRPQPVPALQPGGRARPCGSQEGSSPLLSSSSSLTCSSPTTKGEQQLEWYINIIGTRQILKCDGVFLSPYFKLK